MQQSRISRIVVLLFAGMLISAGSASGGVQVVNLRCEYQVNPLGIDELQPRLSWVVQSGLRGQQQTGWRVRVADSLADLNREQGGLWDSGKVAGGQSIQVEYGGRSLVSGQRCYWKVQIWDKDGVVSDWSEPAWWEMGLLDPGDWQGQWIGDGKPDPAREEDFYQDDPAPLFRREIELSRPVRRARLYLCGLGASQALVNGQPVGDHQLDPAWTAFDKRVFYSTYDLTGQLRTGTNCLAITLGNGWYNPLPLKLFGNFNLREHCCVGRPRFIAQLALEYEDGTQQTIVSDTSWKMTEGPMLRNNIYLGEVYDARRELAGWDQSGYDDSKWRPSAMMAAPPGRLQAQPLPPIKATATLKTAAVTQPAAGVTIYDLGQNFTGWIRLKLEVERGTRIQLRYGELLNADGSLNPMTSVCGQLKGMRKGPDGKEIPAGGPGAPAIAWQSDTYIARGDGPEVYEPKFTFHGFRYVEMTGYPGTAGPEMLEGVRLQSAVEQTGHFSCSNELINQIQTMCDWTFRSNIMSVQSDCPHRERLGYGGDLVTTCDTFMLNYDMANFYTKAVWDWHDAARPDGMLTDTAPFIGIQYCGVGWAMAHPLVQERLYQYYGDRRIIERQYETSKRWFDLVTAQTPDHIIKSGLSDHEALVAAQAPVMVTPLYCESARILGRMAGILGRQQEAQDYQALADAIKQAWQAKFLKPGTGVFGPGTQTSESFALFLDMAPEEEKATALAHLVKDITVTNEGRLTTGIFGVRYMLDVLSRMGRSDLVWQLVTRREFPGWGYMLANGATTLWEHWAISTNTYSHNHPMFGSVSQWFYNWLGGIQPAADAVGFDRIELRPQFITGLEWVACRYDSVRGPVESNWRREGGRIVLTVQIPVGASALLVLPVDGFSSILEGGQPVAQVAGLTLEKTGAGTATLRLAAGRYAFSFSEKSTRIP